METLFVGKKVIFLPETVSSNSYAIELLKNVNLPEGTVVHTDHQLKGRGQRDKGWIADAARNLTFSVVLRPDFLPLQKQFFLYQISALACYDAMAEFLNPGQFDIKIKWPNDILVNGRKIAGILIENNILNNRINWSVTGIGINVNQLQFEESFKATSMQLLTGTDYSVKLILERVCVHLEKYYLDLRNKRFDFIRENYLSNFYGLNQQLPFELNDERRQLLVKGIGESGLLRLETESRQQLEFDVKGVRWIL